MDISVNSFKLTPPNKFFCSLDGNVTNIANGALGNADTSYTYIPLLKSGFNMFSLDYVIQATTLTLEVSNDDPLVLDANANWVDVTSILTSGAATSFTTSGSLSLSLPFPWSRMRVKRVTTNATNALQLLLTRMAM